MRLALALALLVLPLAAQPRRIVSTAPSITEMLYALGLGSRVVGVTTFCRFPEDARVKPKVGTFIQPDYERILSLKPDVVFLLPNPIDLAAKLRGLGLRAEELNQDSIAAILASIRRAGEITGIPEEGVRLSSRLRGDLDALAASVRGRPTVSVVFVIDRTPGTLHGMFGAGHGSYLDELLTIAGGKNILSGTRNLYPKLSLETILATDPEVILDMGDYSHGRDAGAVSSEQKLALWSRYSGLRAVRNKRVHDISADHFVVPGPRMVEAAREFRALLHPEIRP